MPPPNNNQAPTTDLGTAYAELGSSYDPQVQAVQQQQQQAKNAALNDQQQLAENKNTSLSSLDQAKANAFTNNSLTSNARGLFYSGYAPAQNQSYITNTYNPNLDKINTTYQRGVQSSQNTYNTNTQSLQDKIAQLNQQRSNDAYSLVQNTQQAQQQAAKEAAAAAKASQPSQNQIASAISSGLAKATGQDGYVSPEDYASAYADWINAGYSASSFNSTFKNFQNPDNNYYNYAITQAIKRS